MVKFEESNIRIAKNAPIFVGTSDNDDVRVYDVEKKKRLWTGRFEAYGTVIISDDGKYVVVSDCGLFHMMLINIRTGEIVWDKDMEDGTKAIEFSNQGGGMIVCNQYEEDAISLRSIKDGEVVVQWPSRDTCWGSEYTHHWISSDAFCEEGIDMRIGDGIWDYPDRKFGDVGCPVECVFGKNYVLVSSMCTLIKYDLKTEKAIWRYDAQKNGQLGEFSQQLLKGIVDIFSYANGSHSLDRICLNTGALLDRRELSFPLPHHFFLGNYGTLFSWGEEGCIFDVDTLELVTKCCEL